MFWVIQNNLWNEFNFMNLIDCLDRHKIQHEIVKVIPFVNELAGPNNEENPNWSPPSGPVFVCGGTTLVKIAIKKGWKPGVFLNENFNMKQYVKHWNVHMLNHDALFTTFGNFQVKQCPEEFFIRPVNDDKTFAGHLTNRNDFSVWRKRVIKLRETYTSLDENTEIMVSTPKKILQEFRFFIVDQKIVTQSMYKMGNKVVYRNDLCSDALKRFVSDRIDEYGPDRAFVIDIAVLDDNVFKIVEVNCINSSGFYDCDVMKFVEAIELMKFSEFNNDDDGWSEESYTPEQIEALGLKVNYE